MSCPVCNDTGKGPGSDYLDCCKLGCNAAVERAEFNKRLKEAGSMSVEDAAWWGLQQAKSAPQPVIGAYAWFHRGMVNFDAEDVLATFDDGTGKAITLYIDPKLTDHPA